MTRAPGAKTKATARPSTGGKLPLWSSDSNTTGYKGVALNRAGTRHTKPYDVIVKADGKTQNLGSYASKEEAARVYAAYIWSKRKMKADDTAGTSVKPPAAPTAKASSSKPAAKVSKKPAAKTKRTTLRLWRSDNAAGYKGVSKLKGNVTKPWMVVFKRKGKTKMLGSFRTKEDAAVEYARFMWEVNGLQA